MDFIISKLFHNDRILLHRYFFYITRIIDYYMGTNSPYGKKQGGGRTALKQDTARGQPMDLVALMWSLAHMVRAVHTDATESNPNIRPPTTLTDRELLPRNRMDAMLFGKKQFLSMTKLSYNPDSHAELITHVAWEDRSRSMFFISALQESYSHHLDIHNYLLYFRTLITLNDSLLKWRINTMLYYRGRGLLNLVDSDRFDQEKLAAVVVCLVDIIKKTPTVLAWFKRVDIADRAFQNCFYYILNQLDKFDSKAELIIKQISEIKDLKNEYLTLKKEPTEIEFLPSELEYTEIIHWDRL